MSALPSSAHNVLPHAANMTDNIRYAVIHAAEIGVAGGLVTKYFMKEGAFLKPAMWITLSTFIGGQIVYRASTHGSAGEKYRDQLTDNLSVALASATMAGELAAPLVTVPIANALGIAK